MIYNLKRNTQVYLVYGGVKYSLDVYDDFTASQTFVESPVKQKTLHNPEFMFDKAIINNANAANFSFTMPIYVEHDLRVVLNLLMDYTSSYSLNYFDIYFKSNSETYKVEKCVFETSIFSLVKDRIITTNLTGSASKLSKFTGTIPGTPSSATGTTFNYIQFADVKINNVSLSNITALTLELKNNVSWLQNNTVHSALLISSYTDTLYPKEFVLDSRVLSGTIQQYVTDTNATSVNSWNISVPISVQITCRNTTILSVNIPAAVFTNRLDIQDIYVQAFDFRMVNSPTSVSSIMSFV